MTENENAINLSYLVKNMIKNKRCLFEDVNTSISIFQARKEWIRDSIDELEKLAKEIEYRENTIIEEI